MQAIQIKYKGNTYRSKTEAKWAMFLDILECEYIYEPEGYDLGGDTYYCPDFYLLELNLFLEIKPIEGGKYSPTEKLAKQSGKPVITMYGEPSLYDHRKDDSKHGKCDSYGILFHEGEFMPDGNSFGTDFGYAFCLCPVCHTVGIEWRGRGRKLRCECEKKQQMANHNFSNNDVLQEAVMRCRAAFRWEK